jgi:fructokinase
LPHTLKRPIIFGEVLFDRFPDKTVLGGAPFNVAWHLHGFGSFPLLISSVGNDSSGESVKQAMQAWNIDQSGLQTDSSHPTGAVDIQMQDQEHRFEILADQAYDYIDLGLAIQALQTIEPILFYHGSLAVRTERNRKVLNALLDDFTLPVFVDVNLRDPWWEAEHIPAMLKRAQWVKVNDEEIDLLADRFNLAAGSLEAKAQRFLECYDIRLLIVTLGSRGAAAFTAEQEVVRVTPEQNSAIVDTVGAGDAFSSVILLGMMQGWSLTETMQRAQAFASRICQQRGATTANIALYKEMLNKWNSNL